jgi:hypothetical protein
MMSMSPSDMFHLLWHPGTATSEALYAARITFWEKVACVIDTVVP